MDRTMARLAKQDGITWSPYAHVARYSIDQSQWAERLVTRNFGPALPPVEGSALTGRLFRSRLTRKGRRYAEQFTTRNMLISDALKAMAPEDGEAESYGNLLTTTGLTMITNKIQGVTSANGTSGNSNGTYPLSNATTGDYSGCGVGTNGGTIGSGPAVGDVKLVGDGSTMSGASTGCYYQAADATYPTLSAGVMTMQSTFGTAVANGAWNAWCWVSGTAALTGGNAIASLFSTALSVCFVNHKAPASSLGTKASGASWVFTTTITLS